jgi:hypothetical protein
MTRNPFVPVFTTNGSDPTDCKKEKKLLHLKISTRPNIHEKIYMADIWEFHEFCTFGHLEKQWRTYGNSPFLTALQKKCLENQLSKEK